MKGTHCRYGRINSYREVITALEQTILLGFLPLEKAASFLYVEGLLYALKFLRDKTFTVFAVRKTIANSLIREYFEQVLQNHKKMDAEQCPCSVVAFVLDRKYKYGRLFVRYQLVTKFFLVLSGQPCRFVPFICKNKICDC